MQDIADAREKLDQAATEHQVRERERERKTEIQVHPDKRTPNQDTRRPQKTKTRTRDPNRNTRDSTPHGKPSTPKLPPETRTRNLKPETPQHDTITGAQKYQELLSEKDALEERFHVQLRDAIQRAEVEPTPSPFFLNTSTQNSLVYGA